MFPPFGFFIFFQDLIAHRALLKKKKKQLQNNDSCRCSNFSLKNSKCLHLFEFLCADLQHASDSNEGHSHSFIWTIEILKTSNTFKRYLHCMDTTCSLNVLFDPSQYVSYLRVSKNQDLKKRISYFLNT